ncbi:MAG: hypothetical protein Q3979_09335 [Actinomycetaceae bacterium]|nr:hypothetical protein [Actinomycetaceae bacterium]
MNKALYHNLRALIVFGSDVIKQASRELSQARELLDGILRSGKLSRDNRFMDRASRYASQVAINQGQLAIAAGGPEQAESILRDNVSYCRKHAIDYIAEASSEYAYACFLCGNYEKAIKMSTEASLHFFHLGSLRGIEMSRKVLTGSLWEQGRNAEAERVASDIASDRLGLRTIRYINGDY